MSKALTADEMNRILTVAETNAGLKKQLEGLKTTWQLVDSDFASLLSEKETLKAKQEEISKEYENIARNLDKANAKISEILYGNINVGYANGGGSTCNSVTPGPKNLVPGPGKTSGTSSIAAIQNLRDSEIKAKTYHYYMDTKTSAVEKDND